MTSDKSYRQVKKIKINIIAFFYSALNKGTNAIPEAPLSVSKIEHDNKAIEIEK